MKIKNKPLGWRYHKIRCELAYKYHGSNAIYKKHLMIMLAFYEINLYGELLKSDNIFKNRFKRKYNTIWKRL
jgi:hypothetical protein